MKAVSLLAAGIAVIALPLFSGRPQLGLQAAAIVGLLAVVAFIVRGVRMQRDTLRQGNVDSGAVKRAIRALDELIAAIETPVLGASADRTQFVDAGIAIQILTRHRFTSIPTPSSDVEVVARLRALSQDEQFMSLLRNSASKNSRRWNELILSLRGRLHDVEVHLQPVPACLRQLESVDSDSLVGVYWPALMQLHDARALVMARLPAES